MSDLSDLFNALQIPEACVVDRRIPKKRLGEEAPTAADRRRISDSIERLQWRAVLKSGTTGITGFKDQDRVVEELSVLELVLRSDRHANRVIELVHRAIPYLLVLLTKHERHLSISLADKRWSLAEKTRMVLDDDVLIADIDGDGEFASQLLEQLPLTRQPQSSLYSVYRGWINALVAFRVAAHTGEFSLPGSLEHAEHRQGALKRVEMLDAEISRLRLSASKERQMAKRADFNLRLQELRSERAIALAAL